VKLTDTRHIESLPWGSKESKESAHIFSPLAGGKLGGNGDTVYRDVTILRRDYAGFADNGIGHLGQ
jgi:hypothetical protein